MKASKQDQLRRDWYGPRSAEDLAAAYEVSAIYIRKFWAEERKAGRLPPHDPRPYFARHCASPAKPTVIGVDIQTGGMLTNVVRVNGEPVGVVTAIEALDCDNDAEIEDDFADAFMAPIQNIAACADSLAALRAAHPDLVHPIEYVTKDRGKTFQALPHPMIARELWTRPQSQQTA